MERKEEDDPMAEIKAIQPSEETKEKIFIILKLIFKVEIFTFEAVRNWHLSSQMTGIGSKKNCSTSIGLSRGTKRESQFIDEEKANEWKYQGPHRSRAERDGKSKSNGIHGDNRLE